jgi:hypothetical protein
MEVRRPHCQAAQDRRFELADVGDMTGDHRPARIRGPHVGAVSTTRRSAEGSRIAGRSQTVLRQVLGAGREARNPITEGIQDLN